jgi:hypothetical protein
MLVRLKSSFYDGKTFWPIGVHELPDEINGLKVVFYNEKTKPNQGVFTLPRSAEPAEQSDPSPNAPADKPMALSEISNAKSTNFVEAMKTKN